MAFAASLAFGAAAARAETVWIESENTASSNAKAVDGKLNVVTSGWGNAQFLSGGTWFQVNAVGGNVEGVVPESGLVMSYKFNTAKAGNYQIWNRVGFEFARSPFEWRVDGGAWNKSSPDDLTTDLMEIAQWTEIAWLQLGNQQLNAGAHTLNIRLSRTKNDKGEMQGLLYASDAVVISDGEFMPHGKYKPGEYVATAADIAAAKNVFTLPAATSSTRSSVKLEGDWEVARWDEQLPTEVAAPIRDLPTAKAMWKAIAVPSDKNKSRPDLLFAHRLWYRTKVNVPQNQVGRSFFIRFPMNSLNTTVYVNGKLCGFNKNPFAPFQIDVSDAVKAGENEIMVGIRDAWYGRTYNPKNPMNLRRIFNLPISFFSQGFQDLDYPIWNNPASGILEIPTFTSVGAVYASDVFAKPSFANKQLGMEITVNNPTDAAVSGEIQWAAIDDKTGQVAKTFAPKPFSVDANGNRVLNVSDAWTNPQLWWPDSPHMYRLRTTISVGGQAVDTHETSFGFREWKASGIKYMLNGVSWPQWADLSPSGTTIQEFVKDYKAKNQRTWRVMNPGITVQTRNFGMPQDEMFDFMDRNGVNIRRSGMLDGQVIGYRFTESDPEIRAAQGGSEMKVTLMNNSREQFAQLMRSERNHPSINVWTFENEFIYINLINLLGDSPLMDEYERKFTEMTADWQKVDPTRFLISDGGGATKAQTLPIHGNHYVFDPKDSRYPNLAYEMNPLGGSRGRWPWDMKRPRFMGEDFYATGINPADFAQWGGEEMFLSKDTARVGSDIVFNMLMQGYRWAGQGAWHFWVGSYENVNGWNSMKERAVFVREQNWTFGSGQKIKRTFGIFNDTRFDAPITFTRSLVFGKKTVWTKSSVHNIAAGGESKFAEVVPMPLATARANGQLVVSLSVDGKEVFSDTKPLSILPASGAASTVAKPTSAASATKAATAQTAANATKQASLRLETRSNAQTKPAAATAISVYDPKGKVAAYLKARGVAFTALSSLASLPTSRVLVVGSDALSATENTSSALAAWASTGRSVIVLDQKNPLRYQALTAEMNTISNTATETAQTNGQVGFPEDLNHPIMRGLRTNDFRGWGEDGEVYRNAYFKPSRGARSLVQVGPRLEQTALVEVPTGRGVMILSQLELGENLASNAVAQQLMANLLRYASTYKQEFRPVALVASGNAPLVKAADAAGLEYSKSGDVLAAISNPQIKLALVEATPANLKTLAANMTKVNVFMARGGYIVFNGLTPAGLADYNKVVGANHMIRAMRRERVQFSSPRNPLTAGLTLGDVVMLSGEKIFGWLSDEYVANDIFSYIVDYDEVAPFGTSESFLYNNAVNGFVGSDGWKQINDFAVPKSGPSKMAFTLAKPQTITEFVWDGSANYNNTTKVGLVVDGKMQSWDIPANGDAQTLTLKPPMTGKNIELQLQDWEKSATKRTAEGDYLVGIDNIYLKTQRTADFYNKVKPMLNVGGLMQYPRGAGGMLLMNILFKDTEAVPINVIKKRTIFSTVMRNLNAPFAGGKTIIAGAGLNYTPIDFSKFPAKMTQYRTERGWFGDSNRTFNALPRGDQKFAGVNFNIFDFATSPVPTAIMLGGSGIPNNPPNEVRDIPIGRKADALFFLHTARLDNRRNNDEIRDNKKFEMARYIIKYADGQKVTIPIFAEIDIENSRQENPRTIPGAALAWTSKYTDSNEFAVAYSKQWNNPRPDVEIKSVDFTYGPDDQKRGVPVLLAITAATAK